MTIAIIGAGNVGSALARGWAAQGQKVVLGVRDPGRYRQVAQELGGGVGLTTVAQAIALGQVVVLAIPFAAALALAAEVADWGGKTLVDATNPLAPGLSGLTLGTTTSGGEAIAQAARGARVVKAFNTTGAENMADSRYDQGRVMMPVCADDAEAKARVITLAKLLGFAPVDLGDLSAARYSEPFAMTWIHLAIKRGQGRHFAFAMLRRGGEGENPAR